MHVTKLPQSCLLLEYQGQKIVIDPGDEFLKTHSPNELHGVMAALYTHQHPDHCEPSIAESLYRAGVQLFANAATAQVIGPQKCQIITSTDRFNIGDFEIEAYDLPHSLLPDGQEGPQNTGYVINGTLLHPGDSKEIGEMELQVDTVALPITGPDISMFDAFAFAKQLNAKQVIAIHYDKFGANPLAYKAMAERFTMPFTVMVLDDGETTEL